jgi:hypothetical protein
VKDLVKSAEKHQKRISTQVKKQVDRAFEKSPLATKKDLKSMKKKSTKKEKSKKKKRKKK